MESEQVILNLLLMHLSQCKFFRILAGDTMNPATFSLWAKSNPPMALRTHLICTGICAQMYLEAPSSQSILQFFQKSFESDRDAVIAIVGYLCAMHDIGKAHPAFQQRDRSGLDRIMECDASLFEQELAVTGSFRHEYYSGKAANRIWTRRGFDKKASRLLAYVLSQHHQKPECRLPKPKNKQWEEIQDELEEELYSLFLCGQTLKKPIFADATCMLLLSLLIISDWVASSEPFANADDLSLDEMRALAGKTLRLYGLISDQQLPWRASFRELWPEIQTPRPLQTACESLSPDAMLTIIEAPMGEGKTEAALFIANQLCHRFQKSGVYMALPSQATSNQMHHRMNALLSSLDYKDARLLHGNAFLSADAPANIQTEDARIAEKWTRPMRMGLLSQNAVGTVDQAMATVLLSRFSMIRLAGLANKVLIIDEIHAYDMYMSEILEILLCWCRDLGIPVLLLSATMQKKQRQRYMRCFGADDPGGNAYPLITQVLSDGTVVQKETEASSRLAVQLRPVHDDFDASLWSDRALEKVENGGCLAVLVNTVSHAQELFRALREKASSDVRVLLFHSRFPLGRRMEIERECVRAFGKDRAARPGKAILVATQVVEQSIDLDFDGMISELAPIDLLLQRAGRLHRHRENPRPASFLEPIMEVLCPGDQAPEQPDRRYGVSGLVYDPFLLNNTENELRTPRQIRIPEDVREIIERVYGTVNDKNRSEWLKRTVKGQLETEQAKGCTWPYPEPDSFFPYEKNDVYYVEDRDDGFDSAAEAATRLGDDSIRVAFCDQPLFEKAVDGIMDMQDVRKVYLSSVAIRRPRFTCPVSESVYEMKTGKLAGIFLLCGERECTWGNLLMKNDEALGVSWEEIR